MSAERKKDAMDDGRGESARWREFAEMGAGAGTRVRRNVYPSFGPQKG